MNIFVPEPLDYPGLMDYFDPELTISELLGFPDFIT
jgi:hypothetical protein